MKTVWKYQVNGPVLISRTHLRMPRKARLVHLESQGNEICVWAEVETKEETQERCLGIYGTGHPISKDAAYVGTTQIPPFVWHVYEHTSCPVKGLEEGQQHSPEPASSP